MTTYFITRIFKSKLKLENELLTRINQSLNDENLSHLKTIRLLEAEVRGLSSKLASAQNAGLDERELDKYIYRKGGSQQ